MLYHFNFIERPGIRTPELVDAVFDDCFDKDPVYRFLAFNETSSDVNPQLILAAMNNYNW